MSVLWAGNPIALDFSSKGSSTGYNRKVMFVGISVRRLACSIGDECAWNACVCVCVCVHVRRHARKQRGQSHAPARYSQAASTRRITLMRPLLCARDSSEYACANVCAMPARTRLTHTDAHACLHAVWRTGN